MMFCCLALSESVSAHWLRTVCRSLRETQCRFIIYTGSEPFLCAHSHTTVTRKEHSTASRLQQLNIVPSRLLRRLPHTASELGHHYDATE